MDSYISMQPVMKSSDVPPVSVQTRILPNPYSTPQQDVWEYAISRTWLNKWVALGAPATSLQPPGADTPLSPVHVREMDVENCYIGESVWAVLLSWYGLDRQSVKRRRHVNGGYFALPASNGQTCHILADKILDILMLNLCGLGELETPEKHDVLQLYAWDTAMFWESQFKQKLAIADTHQVRLWLIVSHNETETCQQLPQGSQHSFLYHICQACPELVDYLMRRQNKCPAPEHQSAFASFQSGSSCGSSTGYVSVDPEETKSYLFQELLLQKYKVTIAVESVLPDHPTTDSFAANLISSSKMKSKDCCAQPWEGRLKEVLDKMSSNMHGIVDDQREKTEAVCRGVVNSTLSESQKLLEKLKQKIQENEAKSATLAAQEKDLSERESVLNEKLQKFKVGLSDFLVEKKRLEDEMKKIEEMNKIAESKIRLNVGGHKFETSIDTVTKDPKSVLGFMFSGRHSIKREPDGSYFIDRDGTNFRYILNFLRDGDASFPTMPADVKVLRELQKEAQFYKLNGLMDFVNMKIGP